MSNQDLAMMANIRTLTNDGWSIEMETGKRGGQLRSWVKLRHWDRALTFKIRSTPADIQTALAVLMREAGLEPWDPKAEGYRPHVEMERAVHAQTDQA